MSRAENLEQPLESVQAGLNYIVDTGEKPVTYSNASGGNKDTGHTGKYEEHTVQFFPFTIFERRNTDRNPKS